MDMTLPVLQTRDERGVVTLTLNQPAKFNVLSEAVLVSIQQALDAIAQDESVRVLVMRANGKAFCAGHDLNEMMANPRLDYYQGLFKQCGRMMQTLQQLPVPVVAVVQGVATAAGCQLVAQCDLAIAASHAKFATSGIGLGLFCSTPAVPLSRVVPAKQAMEMLMTGEFISAESAKASGLVNRIAEADDLDLETERLVASLVAKPREALAMGKRLFYAQQGLGLAAAYELAAQTMAQNMMAPCAQGGIGAFVNKSKSR
jgi:enoyl-CoA hydratase/carnithine racemase